jgi:hypothetical protein
MSRQYFGDVLTEPIGSAYTTIVATTETVLIPTAFTPINAMEPRAGKVYELIVGGTCTTGASGTLTLTPRFGTTISGTAIGGSNAQTVVPSITTGAFLLRYYLVIRSIGLTGANSTVVGYGEFNNTGAAATAASATAVMMGTTGAAVSVDTSVAQALWMGMTFSVAPSVIPNFHVWRSLN